MASFKPHNHPSNDGGFTLIELLISTAIAMILGAAVFTAFSDFYKNEQENSDINRRISNVSEVQYIATHFLTQASYNGQSTAATLSSPQVQNTQYTQNVGLAIQWIPSSPSGAMCEGTLVDKTLYVASGMQVNGMEWTAKTISGASGSCGDGTSFFPLNNHWAFTLVQRSSCQNSNSNPNAVLLTSNYDYGITNLSGVSGNTNTQVVTVCLPNL